MESLLLAEGGGSCEPSFALNIVTYPVIESKKNQVDPQQQRAQRGKPKKRNKYEKRRFKAAQAKALKRQVAETADDKAIVTHNTENKEQKSEMSGERDDQRDVSPENITENGSDLPSSGVANELGADECENEVDNDDMQEKREEEGDGEEGEDEPDTMNDDSMEHSSIHNNNNNNNLPHDFDERAKYLAEFHARPLEMDRRAGRVIRRVTNGKSSRHLFEQQSSWDNLCATSLHPRLLTAVKQAMGLEQPTLIQSRAMQTFFGNPENGKTSGPNKSNILIQSETGSGKTLAYLLPIVQSLAVDASTGDVHQNNPRTTRGQAGTRCIILCPTRELAAQTLLVAERLLSHTFHWMVPGCLVGDEKRKSEKARIRKGITVLVATPGRLLDHLTRTESLLMALKGKLEWLVADEADRLLDLGLGEQVKQIVQRIRANQPGSGRDGITWRSVLVSATVPSSVEKLAKEVLLGDDKTWVWVKGSSSSAALKAKDEARPSNNTDEETIGALEQEFADSTPRQLMQLHMMVSAKLKLPALVAFLVQRVQKGERTVVFLSTCASVDYYHALFQAMEPIIGGGRGDEKSSDEKKTTSSHGIFGRLCPIYKLHGNIPRADRQMVLRKFTRNDLPDPSVSDSSTRNAAILLATDVASRGLNLPAVDWIVQYDPPGEVSDYVHRAGRVARAGRAGQSLIMLLPSEQAFLQVLKQRGIKQMTGLSLSSTLNSAAAICEDVTRRGVERAGGGLGKVSHQTDSAGSSGSRSGEAFSSELQRLLEGCVIADNAKRREKEKELQRQQKRQKQQHGLHSVAPASASTGAGLLELARQAFISHMRAYPTKEKEVRHIFAAKALHVGHVARSFALKDPPKSLSSRTKGNCGSAEDPSTPTSKRKTAAKMEFQPFDDVDGQEERERKKLRKEALPQGWTKALLLSNAAKLQQNGLQSL